MTTSTRTPRVAVAAVFHETNTFAAGRTELASFERDGRWLERDALLEAFASTRTVVGGMVEEAARRGLHLVPVLGAYATPAGTVTRSAFDTVVERLLDGLASDTAVEGLLLELHGAMVVDGLDDPETLLIEHVREVVGDRPVAIVMDLHANVASPRVGLVDVLVGYRTNPHVDTHESGADATKHLHRLVSGGTTTTLAHARAGVVAAPIAQRTTEPPLVRLLNRARELERRHRFLDVTVHGGYAYADVPHAGLAFTVTAAAADRAAAQDAALELAAIGWHHRHEFAVDLPDAARAVEQAVRLTKDTGGPVAVADTGDNIGGGAPGDATWLLHAVLDAGTVGVATTLCDPAAVAAATEAGVGATIDVELGGHAEILGGPPVVGPATVRALGAGTFVNTGPMAHGALVSMGPTAVVTVGPVDVVLQSLPVQPNDPAMFRSVGLDPTDYDLVLLKGAAALRAGWGGIVAGFVDAGTRGVTDSDLTRLPYRHLRDVWPLADRPPDVMGLPREGDR